MILRIRDDARDDAALFGDAEALFVAQGFEIDIAGHACLSCRCSRVCLCYKLYRDAPRRGQGRRPCGTALSRPAGAVLCKGLRLGFALAPAAAALGDRKSTRLNSSH